MRRKRISVETVTQSESLIMKSMLRQIPSTVCPTSSTGGDAYGCAAGAQRCRASQGIAGHRRASGASGAPAGPTGPIVSLRAVSTPSGVPARDRLQNVAIL